MLIKRIRNRLFSYYFPTTMAASRIRNMPKNNGIVLMYHEVLPDIMNLPAWTIVRQSDFQWQMEFLQSHFDIISIGDAKKRVKDNPSVGRPFAVITLDDGYSGNLNTVLPIMEKLRLPFTIYIATEAIKNNSLYWYDEIINLLQCKDTIIIEITIDRKIHKIRIPALYSQQSRWKLIQKSLSLLKSLSPNDRKSEVYKILKDHTSEMPILRMLTPEEVHTLSKSKLVTIGSHTHGHELLNQLSNDEIYHTLSMSTSCITQWTGKSPKHFAYPNGNYTSSVVKAIGEFGFETAVTTEIGRWGPDTLSLAIPRLSIGRFETKSLFKAKAADRTR